MTKLSSIGFALAVLVAFGLAPFKSAHAILYFDTQAEAAAACNAAKSGVYPYNFRCDNHPDLSYYLCTNDSNVCGTSFGQFRYTEACPTDDVFWMNSVSESSACIDSCTYAADSSSCVTIGEITECYMSGTGTGQDCALPDNSTPLPNGCSITGGVYTCDCQTNPDALVCQSDPDPDVDPIPDPDDPTDPYPDPDYPDPIDPTPDPDPNIPDMPTNPNDGDATNSSPNAPGNTPGGSDVNDGDSTSGSASGQDVSNAANGIISAVNQTTAAVDQNAITVYNAGNQVAGAINLNRTALHQALVAHSAAQIAQANADWARQKANDADISNAITGTLIEASEKARLQNDAIRLQIIAEGVKANADRAADLLLQQQIKGELQDFSQQAQDDAAIATAAANANTAAITAAATAAEGQASATYQAIIDAATQAAQDAIDVESSVNDVEQAISDAAAEAATQHAEAMLAEAETPAEISAALSALLTAQQDTKTAVEGLGEGIDQACNPLSSSECGFQGQAAAADNCSGPPVCTSSNPVDCANLVQNHNVMCAVMLVLDELQDDTPTGSGQSSGDCQVAPECEGNLETCLVVQQQWQAMCFPFTDDGTPFNADSIIPPITSNQFTGEEYTETIDLNAEGGLSFNGGWLAAGSCPVITPAQTSVGQFIIDFTPFCDAAYWISFIMMFTASLAATRIVFA